MKNSIFLIFILSVLAALPAVNGFSDIKPEQTNIPAGSSEKKDNASDEAKPALELSSIDKSRYDVFNSAVVSVRGRNVTINYAQIDKHGNPLMNPKIGRGTPIKLEIYNNDKLVQSGAFSFG